MNAHTLAADDGTPLAARFFEPAEGEARRGAVVIGGAMGVRQDYYRAFAAWLAGGGVACCAVTRAGGCSTTEKNPPFAPA